MVARTQSNRAQPSKLNGAAVKPEASKIHATDESSTGERIYARYQQAQDDLMAFLGAPGWKRTLVAVVSGLVIALGVSTIASTVLGWMMTGAVVAGASTFLAMTVYVLGAIAAAIAGGKLAGRVMGAVLTGEADERAIAAYDAARNFVSKFNPMRLVAKPVTVH